MKQSIGHPRPARPSVPSAGWICFLLLFLVCTARASDLPAALTMDLPISANLALPSWLGQPETPTTDFATLDLPILTPDPNASLLVTVYFEEKQGGFMRVVWKGTQGAQLLSDNFYEGIGMANQRSLLISAATLVGDGILTFQCGDSTLGIERIKFEWLENRTALVSPEVQDVLVKPAVGPTQTARNLNGQNNPAEPGAWQGQIVSVPVSDQAVRIEEGVDFSIDLDTVPGAARLSLKEAGMLLDKRLVVWVNQQRAGTITPAVPDLLDDGFTGETAAAAGYVGWRDGSFYVPVSLLKAGVNSVQFSDEDDSSLTLETGAAADTGLEPPLAVKDVIMQLDYTPVPAPAAATPPPQFSSPIGPIEPSRIP